MASFHLQQKRTALGSRKMPSLCMSGNFDVVNKALQLIQVLARVTKGETIGRDGSLLKAT